MSMPVTDGPEPTFDDSASIADHPANGNVDPGLVEEPVEAISGAPTPAFWGTVVPGNVLDLQYQGLDGVVQFKRVVFDSMTGSAIYAFGDDRNARIAFQLSQIVGASIVI